jgi:hypothetical protein
MKYGSYETGYRSLTALLPTNIDTTARKPMILYVCKYLKNGDTKNEHGLVRKTVYK